MLVEALILICPVEFPHAQCTHETAAIIESRYVEGTNCAQAAIAILQGDTAFRLASMDGFYPKVSCRVGGGTPAPRL